MTPIGLRDLFVIFLKAGLAFGGGLGILAVLEDELVTKRKALTREEFLTVYALGRIVPSGTMTALAAAFGTRFGGAPGSVMSSSCSFWAISSCSRSSSCSPWPSRTGLPATSRSTGAPISAR